MTRFTMRCSKCGSACCGRDCSASWDDETQEWIAGSVHDNTWCDDCGADDPGLDEVPLTDDGQAAGRQMYTVKVEGRGHFKPYTQFSETYEIEAEDEDQAEEFARARAGNYGKATSVVVLDSPKAAMLQAAAIFQGAAGA